MTDPPAPEAPAMDLPSHPESEDLGSQRRPTPTTSRATVAVFVVIGVLVAAIVVLHLTSVVGPGAH